MLFFDLKYLITICGIVTFGIWVVVMNLTSTTFGFNLLSIMRLWTAIGITGTILLPLFTYWAWKFPIFQRWLVNVPYIEGTWKGTCISNWVDPTTGVTPPPIEMYLVIKQTLLTIHCTVFTVESTSQSLAASFCIDSIWGSRCLTYTFRNRPEINIRHRSQIHEGTAIFDIIGSPANLLKGEYWTNRQTTGLIQLQFVSRDRADCFNVAQSISNSLNKS